MIHTMDLEGVPSKIKCKLFHLIPSTSKKGTGCLFYKISSDFRDNISYTKRCLLLGRKVMTNLDSILKSRNATLPTKVRLAKGMVFPVLRYGNDAYTFTVMPACILADQDHKDRALSSWEQRDPTSPF